MSEYKETGVIFGGAKTFNKSVANFYNDNNIYIFHPRNYYFQRVKVQDGPKPEGRRYHSACVSENNLLVSGGLGNSSQLLFDHWSFDLGN